MRKNIFLVLIAIFGLAFFLRVLYLPDNALTFGYDQARDAFVAQQILEGDLKILGPPASTPGLFHGVFYYYFLAPAYLLGNGSPIIAAYWSALFNALTVFTVYFLAYFLTKKVKPALLASFLFAISYGATQYAVWLSNPTLGIWTAPLIYLGLWLWITKNIKWAPILTAIGLGLSIQSEIFLAYHLLPVLLWLWIARNKVIKREVIQFLAILVLSLSTMVLVEFKFGFQGFAGIANLLSSGDAVLSGRNVGDFLILYLNQIGRTFSNNLLPSNAGYGGALGIALLVWSYLKWQSNKRKKTISWQPFIATYILAHLPIVTMGGISTPFLTVGLGVGAVLLAGIAIYSLWPTKKIIAAVLVFLIVASNISTIISEGKKGQIIFAIQNDMLLAKEIPALDYIYGEADGEAFSINTLTSPLWVNTTWSYLFNWYGKKTYGYIPSWRGRDQVGRLGNNLEPASIDTKLHFYIKEPSQGIPKHYLESEPAVEDAQSRVISEKQFGEITIQKREILTENK